MKMDPWIKRLAAAGNGNPKRSVEELAAHVLGCKPLEIYFRELSAAQQAELDGLILRAERGEPIQYLIGHVDFRGLKIRCDRRALIPRPETELLVQVVLEEVAEAASLCMKRQDAASTLKIADVCTGTGCIGLALAYELPKAQVTAIDISPEALSLARENAERLGLSDRVAFVHGDLLGADAAGCYVNQRQDAAAAFVNQFDLVVSNPPYIGTGVCLALDRSVRDFEPMLALDGGADGLDLIRRLAEQACRVLKPGGGLFVEIGFDQGEAVFQCLEKAGFENIRIIKDLAGLDRVVQGERGVGGGRSDGLKV